VGYVPYEISNSKKVRNVSFTAICSHSGTLPLKFANLGLKYWGLDTEILLFLFSCYCLLCTVLGIFPSCLGHREQAKDVSVIESASNQRTPINFKINARETYLESFRAHIYCAEFK
jgi:hypothetical protein